MRHYLIIGMVVLLMALAAGCATPSPEERRLLQQIEQSPNPDAHRRLASFYRQEAQALKQKAKYHEVEMPQRYKFFPGKVDWPTHCRNLASYYARAAEKYEALAQTHEQAAERLR